ncbi:MAG TPA: hypothetical protein PKA27_03515 [Fimbriimonadaceae bacterium]|nr:hypothetical protein [Fimbriimonadaceae bacterium]
MNWRFEVFGDTALFAPNGERFVSRSQKLRVLLALVALQPDLTMDRRALADAIFDDEDLPGLPNLSLLLTRSTNSIRALSTDRLLDITPYRVGFHRDVINLDLAEFRALASSPDPSKWVQAATLAKAPIATDLDHPAVHPFRSRIANEVLDLLSGLAKSAYGPQSISLILDRVQKFDFDNQLTSARLEPLITLYAALGLKDHVVRAYEAYEALLDDEYGETPSQAQEALFNALLDQLDAPAKQSKERLRPIRPPVTFGRDELLQTLQEKATKTETTQVLSLVGQSGVGKSHLLRELYWRLADSTGDQVDYIDLETTAANKVATYVSESSSAVLLIDHFSPEAPEGLLEAFRGNTIILSGHRRLGIEPEVVYLVGPIDAASAKEMLVDQIRQVQTSTPTNLNDDDLNQLVGLCEQLPLALELAGRLAGTIGTAATVSAMLRGLENLTVGEGVQNRKTSLELAIQTSLDYLSDEAKEIVAILASLRTSCHPDLLLFGAGLKPNRLEESILAGLVYWDDTRQNVKVSPTTASCVTPVESDAQLNFAYRVVQWFTDVRSRNTIDLTISSSIELALRVATDLIKQGSTDLSLRLIASLRPWLGNQPLRRSQIEPAVEAALSCVDSELWVEAILALSAAYFHAGEFSAMAGLLDRAIREPSFEHQSSDYRCQLLMQRALAQRCLGSVESAIQGYLDALNAAKAEVQPSTLVKCYYNLGTLLESEERLPEALNAQESAAANFDPTTDPRVETLVNTSIARLRYRVERDLVGASLILEATLAHASHRKDRRSMAEVLQNLGLIYWEREMPARAALAELVGTRLLLEHGYTPEFRRLARSSFVTLACAMHMLGEPEPARSLRAAIDRLGNSPLYTPNQAMFDQLVEWTYASPPGLRLAMVADHEISQTLAFTLERLLTRLEHEDRIGEVGRVASDVLGSLIPQAPQSTNQSKSSA